MEFLPLGTVIKPHGLHGEVYVVLTTPERHWLSELTSVKLGPSSFETDKIRAHKKGVLWKARGIDSIEDAEALRGLEFFVPRRHFTSRPGENFFLSEVLGFRVRDQTGVSRGRILGFEQTPAQDLARVGDESASFLVPFLEANTLKKDWETEEITLHIPEGLEDLNP